MKPILLDVPMPILTPRLMIRPRQVGEGRVIAQAVRESLEHLKPWMPFAQQYPSDELMEEHCRQALAGFILRSDFTLSIYDRAGQVFIGSTGLHKPDFIVRSFEMGYWAHKSFVGKGYISEAVNALTRYAFDVFRAKRVELRCDSRNQRSLAVMTRLGFGQEGSLRYHGLGPDGSARDTVITARYDTSGLPDLSVQW